MVSKYNKTNKKASDRVTDTNVVQLQNAKNSSLEKQKRREGSVERITIVASNTFSAKQKNHTEFISFQRPELDVILALYGRKVVAGEWRDYALDTLKDKAVFSVFRHTSEMPLYRIEKNPKLANRQGAYSVVSASGLIMKRGSDLKSVLRVLEKPRRITYL